MNCFVAFAPRNDGWEAWTLPPLTELLKPSSTIRAHAPPPAS